MGKYANSSIVVLDGLLRRPQTFIPITPNFLIVLVFRLCTRYRLSFKLTISTLLNFVVA